MLEHGISPYSVIKDCETNQGRLSPQIKNILQPFVFSTICEFVKDKIHNPLTRNFHFIFYHSNYVVGEVGKTQFKLHLFQEDVNEMVKTSSSSYTAMKKNNDYVVFILFQVNLTRKDILDSRSSSSKSVIICDDESFQKMIDIRGVYLMRNTVFDNIKRINFGKSKIIKLSESIKIYDKRTDLNKQIAVVKNEEDRQVENVLCDEGRMVMCSSSSPTPPPPKDLDEKKGDQQPSLITHKYIPFSLSLYLRQYYHLSTTLKVHEKEEEEEEVWSDIDKYIIHTKDDYVEYLQLVCEYTLFYQLTEKNVGYLSQMEKRKLKDKFIKRYNNIHHSVCPSSHNQLFMDFLSQLVKCALEYKPFSSYNKNMIHPLAHSNNISYILYDSLWCILPLTKEIVNTELFLFRHITPKNVDFIQSFHEVVTSHIKQFKRDVDHFSFTPSWFDYLFNCSNKDGPTDASLVLWEILPPPPLPQSTHQRREYKIRYEFWLKNTGRNTKVEKLPIHKGFVHVDEKKMVDVFLPLIYENMLKDMVVYVLYMNIFKRCKQDEYTKLYFNANFWFYEEIALKLAEYNLMVPTTTITSYSYSSSSSATVIQLYDAFYELSCEYVNHSSPVIRKWEKMVQRDIKKTTTSSSSSSPFSSFVLPDIEDIRFDKKKCCEGGGNDLIVQNGRMKRRNDSTDVLPQCLRKLMNLSYLHHQDRWNLIKYLYQLGYKEIDVLHVLEGKVKECDIKSLYKDCQLHSSRNELNVFRCGSVINLTNAPNNFLRCHYEEKHEHENKEKYGDRRRHNYSTKEKKDFISQCFNPIIKRNENAVDDDEDRESSRSPLDFVKIKTNSSSTM
jgi:hypothetical protein